MSVTYPTAQRYTNITSAVLGATYGVNTIKEIAYSSEIKEIEDAGDSDTDVSFLAQGLEKIKGTITLSDPVQAAALKGQSAANFVFTGTNPMTGYIVTVTLTGFLAFGYNGTQKHNDVSGCRVPFRAVSATVASASS